MEITVIASSEKYIVKVNGEMKARFLNGEVEDANIRRDFSDVWLIPDLMWLAYDAGKRGEDFIIEEIKSDECPY